MKEATECDENGKPFLKHRKLIESDYPEKSMVVSGETAFGKAIVEDLHNRFHNCDKRRAKAHLRCSNPSYHVPGLTTKLGIMEEECLLCRQRNVIPGHTKMGTLPPERFKRFPIMQKCCT